ncbi:MAG: ECF transporter S component [Lachnospiraceae bacterium]|nr:ECF transporter S component [Lachnospiraceae bacterium]MDN4742007.1 ECF transporter S component [Lachnospiraceae bacterium C1.1]
MRSTAVVNSAAENAQARTKYMVELALMVAITLVMAMTPLGYFKTPGLSITLLTIPVSIAAIMLGPLGGAVCGTAFGITSFINGFSGAFASLISINIFGFFCMTIVARCLEGFLTGLIFKSLHAIKPASKFSFFVSSLACPLLNTLLFMGSLVLFFYNAPVIQGFVDALGVSNPLTFVFAFVGTQGAIEAIVCCLVATALSQTLYKVFRKQA